LWIYLTAIEVAGGTNSTKVIYFPMALESAPLTWLEILRHDSIHSWEDLKKIFIDNFQGSIHCPATRHDLRLCKQERGEALRTYIKRFFDTRATIANIADDDVINRFHNGLAAQQLYQDFGRNRPRSVVALRDMMLTWADQEEQERDRFPRREDNNQKRNGDPRSDKSQCNFDKKRKPKDTVTTMDRGQRGKKGNQQDDFQKLLARPCPLHPKGKHTILECINLCKSLQER